ncbi:MULTISPECIES: succinate--CoA ligase subunit alpha [Desulfofundulus]|uniref:Succinate--CoA ligase [ADP-forming] subunit alpha n=1 Tax=Desulfofundulus australicus DSM 11792 TaxID=1121425 RepID=A0A1M4TYR7_9FIRM|nr:MULTISPECIES: succinate--CoA ligase subunit alpha [Desulfofundulus]MBE3585082.1 succinate--CoA ligase subunit alpha [Thermoanaerobacter sp.]MCS5695905.1 succinate--CoA ligase subunit alpha [Desulfofundulus thermocisternus]SHE49504.1 succinyl-CoA synthetase alpha subunit [Desulfofundulus australicus DSM 11792]
MAIIVGEKTSVLVQGITGNQGTFHTKQMLAYGTRIVAGVSPGKGGQTVEGVPVYDTVAAAMENHQIDASVLFIPAPFAKDAAFEAIAAGIRVVVIITEHIPVHDEMEIIAFARRRGTIIIGPNTFGIVSSGRCKIGIPPNQFFVPGHIGVVARSGTLTYEIVANLTASGLGQSTVVGLGGDRVVGLSFVDVLEKFERDPETRAVVLVGEIGGNAEEEAALFIKKMTKPVVAYIAGKSAPPGKRMGHAGAIIERGKGTFEGKVKALTAAGARVATLPFEVPELIKEALG